MTVISDLITTLDSVCNNKTQTVEVAVTICHLVVNGHHTWFSAQTESKNVPPGLDYYVYTIIINMCLRKSGMAHWPRHLLILNK